MTIIECFERTPIENMISCLAVKPKKIIFIGSSEQTPKEITLYRHFVEHKKLFTRIEYRTVLTNDLNDIVNTFTDIVESEKECSFDLTGGDDLFLVAIGMVYERYHGEMPIKLHRFDLRTGKMLDCDGDGNVIFSGIPQLSIRDHIELYGGEVASSGISGSSLTIELKTAIDVLWNISKNNSGNWNKETGALAQFEKYRSKSQNPLYIHLNLSLLSQKIHNFNERKNLALSVLKKLQKANMIYNLSVTPTNIKYVYKNASVKYCLLKSGNILEFKVLAEAAAVTQNGASLYHDCLNGVMIEWDNEIAPYTTLPYETKNEIDVILMHRLTPVFISCKNGTVDEEELYKLNTVALRFGGMSAKKVLITTHIEIEGSGSVQPFLQRAKDMDILLIDEVCAFGDAEWKQALADIIS